MIRKYVMVVGLIGALTGLARSEGPECFDHTVWDKILEANVELDGTVHYEGVRINKGGTLYEYLTFLEIKRLSDCNANEQLAFWINAYNANVFRLIIETPGTQIVNEKGGILTKRFEVANKSLSLGRLLNRIIRSDPKKGGPYPKFSLKELDPRVHFALVNGSLGGPKIAPRAFTGTDVNEQLQTASERFANDSTELYIENDQLVMPAFLKWYQGDFEKVGGVGSFLSTLIDPTKRPDAKEIKEKLKTDFPDNVRFVYDWSLNRAQR